MFVKAALLIQAEGLKEKQVSLRLEFKSAEKLPVTGVMADVHSWSPSQLDQNVDRVLEETSQLQ